MMRIIIILILLFVSAASWSTYGQEENDLQTEQVDMSLSNLKIPTLPFADNPDPLFCGIPEAWNDEKSAWITGLYENKVVQEVVYLYDSHLRKAVVGQIASGTQVKIILFQSNPTLNYYFVKSIGLEPIQEGWVPAPFISFEQP